MAKKKERLKIRDQDLTAAPYDLSLKDHVYQAHPFSDRDISELDNYVRMEYMKRIRESLDPKLSKEDRREELDIAQQKAVTLKWSVDLGKHLVSGELPGLARFVQQMIKKSHPNVTVEELIPQLADADAIEEVFRVFAYLNDLSEEDAKEVGNIHEKKQA